MSRSIVVYPHLVVNLNKTFTLSAKMRADLHFYIQMTVTPDKFVYNLNSAVDQPLLHRSVHILNSLSQNNTENMYKHQ